jgi:hypothetical protein
MDYRVRAVLERAAADAAFRARLMDVARLRDQFTYPSAEGWCRLSTPLLQLLSDAGLLKGINQARLNELTEWSLENIDELAYCAQGWRKACPSKRFSKPVGEVFISWTVKTPRTRAVAIAIRAALEHFNITYFDYTQNALSGEADLCPVNVKVVVA